MTAVPILTDHIHRYRAAVTQVHRKYVGAFGDAEVTESEEMDKLIVQHYRKGKVQGLHSQGNRFIFFVCAVASQSPPQQGRVLRLGSRLPPPCCGPHLADIVSGQRVQEHAISVASA